MENKVLTVVIPTYNMERLLDKCLTSLVVVSPLSSPENTDLMEQLEVLVVIDGATDRSSEIAHRYQDKYPQTFRVIDKENDNYGSCINRGLAEARGKYIKVLDADDYFDTSAFAHIISLLSQTDVDLVITNYKTVCDNGEDSKLMRFDLPANQILPTAALGRQGRQMAMHAVTYKTKNLRDIKYKQTEHISYTDQEWIFEPMTTVKTFTYFDICLYNYLIGRSGQTMDIRCLAKNIIHNLIVLENNIKVLDKQKASDEIFEYLWERLSGFAEYIYSLFLYNMNTIDISPLIVFDKKLAAESPILFRYLSTIKAGRFPLVRLWRVFYYKNDYGFHDFFRKRKYRLFIKDKV